MSAERATELELEEAAHIQTIAERDAAEEALGRAYALVTGREPVWSNLFGYARALAEIKEHMAAGDRS